MGVSACRAANVSVARVSLHRVRGRCHGETKVESVRNHLVPPLTLSRPSMTNEDSLPQQLNHPGTSHAFAHRGAQ
jgi:hypothetical protein